MVERHLPHVCVWVVGDQFPRNDMRVFNDLRCVVDRTDGDLRCLEEGDVLRLCSIGDEGTDDRVELFDIAQPISIRAETRVVH